MYFFKRLGMEDKGWKILLDEETEDLAEIDTYKVAQN